MKTTPHCNRCHAIARTSGSVAAASILLVAGATTAQAGVAAELVIFQSFLVEHGDLLKIITASVVLTAFLLGRIQAVRRIQLLRQLIRIIRIFGVVIFILAFIGPTIIPKLLSL